MGVRPSELIGLVNPDDPWAFWFDRAVIRFGQMVESDISEVVEGVKTEKEGKRRAQDRLSKWLDFDGTMTNQRFATPPITKKRKTES